MKTVADSVRERVDALRGLLREFLLEHSGGLRDFNRRDSEIFIVGPSRAWADLDQDGRRLQSRLLEENRRLSALIRALLKHAPSDSRKTLESAQKTLLELVDQSHLTWVKTTEQAFFRSREGARQTARTNREYVRPGRRSRDLRARHKRAPLEPRP